MIKKYLNLLRPDAYDAKKYTYDVNARALEFMESGDVESAINALIKDINSDAALQQTYLFGIELLMARGDNLQAKELCEKGDKKFFKKDCQRNDDNLALLGRFALCLELTEKYSDAIFQLKRIEKISGVTTKEARERCEKKLEELEELENLRRLGMLAKATSNSELANPPPSKTSSSTYRAPASTKPEPKSKPPAKPPTTQYVIISLGELAGVNVEKGGDLSYLKATLLSKSPAGTGEEKEKKPRQKPKATRSPMLPVSTGKKRKRKPKATLKNRATPPKTHVSQTLLAGQDTSSAPVANGAPNTAQFSWLGGIVSYCSSFFPFFPNPPPALSPLQSGSTQNTTMPSKGI